MRRHQSQIWKRADGRADSTPGNSRYEAVVWTLLKTRGAPLVGKNKSVLTSGYEEKKLGG
jgi:hypothetical protein